MKSTRTITGIFILSVLAVLAAMVWVSAAAWQLECARRSVGRWAATEEKARLALWRMDSWLAPLVAQESARPYFVYSDYFSAEYGFNWLYGGNLPPRTMIPSPLREQTPPYVLLHFQFDPQGRFSSPQVREDVKGGGVKTPGSKTGAQEKYRRIFAEIAQSLDRNLLAARLPAPQPPVLQAVNLRNVPPPPQQTTNAPPGQSSRQAQPPPRQEMQQGQARNLQEYAQRAQVVEINTAALLQLQAGNRPTPQNRSFDEEKNNALAATDVNGAVMTPLWIDGRLVLARRIAVRGEEYLQGCLLDWPAIQAWLKDEIADLLPEARLEPLAQPPGSEEDHLLTALPVRLLPGAVEIPGTPGLSPIVLSLVVAWLCVVAAMVVVGVSLAGLIRLSERRATFVSAVTHELRTPLTTFQMYTEMLAERMVPHPEQQRQYLHTLRAEALRLTHLVENVLAYARLERGRLDRRLESLCLGELVSALEERLHAHAQRAGMTLVVDDPESAADVVVRANVSAVEQILFNLVDNACKYAAAAEDKRIHLTLGRGPRHGRLQVRDHGPGLEPMFAKRLFRPFSKSAREAAHSAPGVGLGLALSRRLARDLGGDLKYESDTSDGARFLLSLPRAT